MAPAAAAAGPSNAGRPRRQSATATTSPFAVGRHAPLRSSPSTSALRPSPAALSPSSPSFVDSHPPLPQPQQVRPKPSLSRLLKKPSLLGPLLRGMQSFDSARTARPPSSSAVVAPSPAARPPLGSTGDDDAPDTPPRADPAPRRPRLASIAAAAPTAAGGEAENDPPAAGAVDAHALWSWFALDGTADDARVVLWRRSSMPLDPRSPTTSAFPPGAPAGPSAAPAPAAQLLAATPERWVLHLTAALDPDGAFDFLLVYRAFLSPGALLTLLTSRFEWACTAGAPSSAADGGDAQHKQQQQQLEAALTLVRSRTVSLLAFWLANFFAADWLPSLALRRQLTSWLNARRQDRSLDGVLGARGLLRKLKGVVKDQKRAFGNAEGRTAFDARQGAGTGVDDDDAFDGGRPASPSPRPPPTPARQTAVFPTRRKALSTVSPPSAFSLGPTSASTPADGPPTFNKHAVAKLWGSIGRAAARRTTTAAAAVTKRPVPPVSGAAFGASPFARSDASVDGLFEVDLASAGKAGGGLEAYLRATAAAAAAGGPEGKAASLSDPETRSSRSDSTRASSAASGAPASAAGAGGEAAGNDEHAAAVVGVEAHEAQPTTTAAAAGPHPHPHALPPPPLEKVDEERSSCELSPADRRPTTSAPPSPRALEPFPRSSPSPIDVAPSLPPAPLPLSAPAAPRALDFAPRALDFAPRALDFAPAVGPSPVDSTFSATTTAAASGSAPSSRADGASFASECSTDDEGFRVRPRRPAGQPKQAPEKPTWTPVVPFATIALDDVSLSGSDDDDDDDSWHSHARASSSTSSSLGDGPAGGRRLPAGTRQLNLHRQSLDALGAFPPVPSPPSSPSGRPSGRPLVPRAGSTTPSAASSGASTTESGAWHHSLLARFDLAAVELSDDDGSNADADDGGVAAALRRLNGEYDQEKRKARERKIERLVAANREAWKRHEPLPARRGGSGEFDLIEPETMLLPPPPPLVPAAAGLGPAFELAPPAKVGHAPAVDDEDEAPPPPPSTPAGHPSLPPVGPPTRRLSAPVPARPALSPPSSAPSSFALAATATRARASTHSARAATAARAVPQPGPTSPHKPLAATTPGRRRSLTKRRPAGQGSPGAALPPVAGPHAPVRSRSFFPSVQPAVRHQSFILSFKTTVLAAQFSLIDAQLLNAVGFEELARRPAPWLARPLPALNSWEALWRERALCKAGLGARASDVSMLVRRFELVVRWVETELVLTARAGRSALVTLVERFVKLAAALFQMSNLQSCVAVMQGLQTPLIASVMQAHKAWPKLALWERRVFKDLRLITGPDGGWANVRKAHASVLAAHGGCFFEHALLGPAGVPAAAAASSTKSPTAAAPAASTASLTGATREDGFLPFVGVYLDDLAALDAYPDFVAPRIAEAVRARLPVLPDGVPADGTLVNVDKATQHAAIIREICLFKTLAARFSAVPAETVPFQLCFKLRAAAPAALFSLAQLSVPR